MNPRQLDAFLATVRAGSITAAARTLNIAQPSASRLIADLEKTVGFRLFVRAGRGLVPTPEARRFHLAVESMYIGLDRLREAADAIRHSGDDVLSLGMISVFTYSKFVSAVSDVHRTRDAVRISISVQTNQAIIDAVRMQKLDLGIVSSLHSLEGLHTFVEVAVPYVCLLPKQHPLAKRDRPISLTQIKDASFVALPVEYLENASVDSQLIEQLHSEARLRSHSVPAVASIARHTGALAVVDPFTAQVAEALGGMVTRPLVEDVRFPIAVVSRAVDTLSEAGHDLARRLVERLQQALEEIA